MIIKEENGSLYIAAEENKILEDLEGNQFNCIYLAIDSDYSNIKEVDYIEPENIEEIIIPNMEKEHILEEPIIDFNEN